MAEYNGFIYSVNNSPHELDEVNPISLLLIFIITTVIVALLQGAVPLTSYLKIVPPNGNKLSSTVLPDNAPVVSTSTQVPPASCEPSKAVNKSILPEPSKTKRGPFVKPTTGPLKTGNVVFEIFETTPFISVN